MKTERVRVICPTCNAEILSFFTRDGRLKVTSYGPGASLSLSADGSPVGNPGHRLAFTSDVEEDLADCTDESLDLECACMVRSLGLRAFADAARSQIGAQGSRVGTVKA